MHVLVISDYRSFHTVRPEAEIFIALASAGIQISIMTYGDAAYCKEFKDAGIQVIDFHPEKKFNTAEIEFIRNYIENKRVDIVHLFNSKAIINGIQAAKKTKAKIILYRGFTGHIHWYDPSIYLKYFHPAVAAIQCNSKGVAELFEKQFVLTKKKLFIINKGHRTSWYAGTPRIDIRSMFELPDDSFVLINVANNRKMKGIPYLLKAIALLPPEMPVRLILVGHDMETKENIELLEKSNAREKVVFTGFRKDALSLVASSDAFVLSSLFGESITKAVIEAMSLGIPPIITDIPGNYELIEDKISGMRVKSHSAEALSEGMVSMWKLGKEKRMEMGKNSVKHIDEILNTGNTVIGVKKMYEEILQVNGNS
jgi:glycosyltransferase involved in cell wall biosynthesis